MSKEKDGELHNGDEQKSLSNKSEKNSTSSTKISNKQFIKRITPRSVSELFISELYKLYETIKKTSDNTTLEALDSKQDVFMILIKDTIESYFRCLQYASEDLKKIGTKQFSTEQEKKLSKNASEIAILIDNFIQANKELLKINIPDNFPDINGFLGKNTGSTTLFYQNKTQILNDQRQLHTTYVNAPSPYPGMHPSIPNTPDAQTRSLAAQASMSNTQTVKNDSSHIYPSPINLPETILAPLVLSSPEPIANIAEINPENFEARIREKTANKNFDPNLINSYIDASRSFFTYSRKIISTEELYAKARSEFEQNLFILNNQKLENNFIQLIRDIEEKLKSLPAVGEGFDLQISTVSEIHNFAEIFSQLRRADRRELNQDNHIRKTINAVESVANYFCKICEIFDLKIESYSSPAFTQIALSFGSNPDTRVKEGFKQTDENPSLLHKFAAKGDYETICMLLQKGANPNILTSYVKNVKDMFLFDIVQNIYEFFQLYVMGKRLAERKGETALIAPSKKLLEFSNQDNLSDDQKESEFNYLRTVYKLISAGTDTKIADHSSTCSLDILTKYVDKRDAENKDPGLSLSERLYKVQNNMEAGIIIKKLIDHQKTKNTDQDLEVSYLKKLLDLCSYGVDLDKIVEKLKDDFSNYIESREPNIVTNKDSNTQIEAIYKKLQPLVVGIDTSCVPHSQKTWVGKISGAGHTSPSPNPPNHKSSLTYPTYIQKPVSPEHMRKTIPNGTTHARHLSSIDPRFARGHGL